MSEKVIRVKQQQKTKKLGDLYGLFFEDINHAVDGGIYAELVQNRSFEYCEIDYKEYTHFTAWEKSGNCEWSIETEKPLAKFNTHYLRVNGENGAIIKNQGYNNGVYVKAGKKYRFSVYLRNKNQEEKQIVVRVSDKDFGVCCGEGYFNCSITSHDEWKKYKLEFMATKTTTCGELQLIFADGGEYDIDMVSLFPKDTFRNGLRKDIVTALQEMKPKFMRFPGGCITHAGSLDKYARDSMYRWKMTLGNVEERPTWKNNWNCNQSLGIGFYEYFCMCEDIGAKPIPVLPGGFNSHTQEGAWGKELEEWVQEALDLIEFANGDCQTTEWGRVRAQLGHQEPFGLEYIGIGNEEIGDGFFERYPYFHKAIREKYPEIKIINSAGPFATGQWNRAGWNSAREHGSDLVDEHYYAAPEWFLANMHHYDDYDENGVKVFLGEYASWGNTYYNAIVEAAYMTHLEKAKAVALACYAPMLCNVDYVYWRPDMLWFNNHEILKTANYHVQKMFMENQGTDEVQVETENLSEVLELIDGRSLWGQIELMGEKIEGKVWDVSLEKKTGKIYLGEEIQISNQKVQHLFDVNDEEYTLSFKFLRTSGENGLRITFAKTDDQNMLNWHFGGWKGTESNVNATTNGRTTTVSNKSFGMENEVYDVRLEVKGRHIKTYINQELYNDFEQRVPEIEELYVAASIDETTNQTIVKVVNLLGEEKEVDIVLDGEEREKVTLMLLQGNQLTDENTFEQKELIHVTTKSRSVENNKIKHIFKPHSVTVLVFE